MQTCSTPDRFSVVSAMVMVLPQYVAQLLAVGGSPLTVNLYQVLVTGAAMTYGPLDAQFARVAAWVPMVVFAPSASTTKSARAS